MSACSRRRPSTDPLEAAPSDAPLADRMSEPLADYCGQTHLVGEDASSAAPWRASSPSRSSWAAGRGRRPRPPAGAWLAFVPYSAALRHREIRELMARAAADRQRTGRRTRLRRRDPPLQQGPGRLPAARGARRHRPRGRDDENPSFEVNGALLSRCRALLPSAAGGRGGAAPAARPGSTRGARGRWSVEEGVRAHRRCDRRGRAPGPDRLGDRGGASAGGGRHPAGGRGVPQRKVTLYDKSGEEHYNVISALHKSIRNSDPDATSTG